MKSIDDNLDSSWESSPNDSGYRKRTYFAERGLSSLFKIFTIPVTPFAQNARVLYDSEADSAAIIDPGGDVDRIWSVIDQIQPGQLSIVLTHAHIDHAGGTASCLARAAKQFTAKTHLYAHSDGLLRQTISQQAMFYGLPESQYCDAPEPDVVLGDGDKLAVGSILARSLWTPGHAPDHLSFYFDVKEVELHEAGQTYAVQFPVLIAGDALFAGSIGRTDLPGGDTRLLLRSIHEKLLTLPENTVVLPGHGPPTTIGQEKATNPYLQE